MAQKQDLPAAGSAPRTRIEDLECSATELSEEEASVAAGGLVLTDPAHLTILGPSLLIPEGPAGHTKFANSCTAGDAQKSSDTDFGDD
jgi:hypothetical protein